MNEKLDIVHQVIVNLKSHKDVADIYKVKPAVVGRLVRKASKNKSYLSEMRLKAYDKQSERRLI